MFNMFTTLDGVLLEDDYVVFVATRDCEFFPVLRCVKLV